VSDEIPRKRVTVAEGGTLRTKQGPRSDQDVNTIMGRWIGQGIPPRMGPRQAMYGDFAAAPDFHTAQNLVIEAREQFMDLPARVRKACKNDPGEFLTMVSDPERRAELVELGLVEEHVPHFAREAKAIADAITASNAEAEKPPAPDA